jgi:hypothetical protein
VYPVHVKGAMTLMLNLTSDDLKFIVRMICSTTMGVMAIKLAMCMIHEVFCKNCKHCGKKAG